mgnify:CR=1 FL=1
MDGMKEAVDNMATATGEAEGVLAEGTTTQEDIDKLRAAIDAVKELYIDTVALNTAIAYAENLIANTEVGDELGQTTQEAIDALQSVLNDVNL